MNELNAGRVERPILVESTLGGAVGFTVGARVSHPVHGNGIITRLIPPDNALVAIKDGFNRAWLDLPITELAIDGKPAKFLPEWTNPSVHLKDFKTIQIRFPSSNPELGCLPGADDAKVYCRRTKGGKRLKQRDYTRAVNSQIAKLLQAAMPPTPTEKPNKIRLRVYGWATLYARIDFLQMGLAGEPVWMFVSQQFGEVWIRQSRIIDLWIQVGVKRRDRYVPILERRTDV